MLKSVTVTNFRGESLRMELSNPYLSGLLITSIDGLGPAKADINKSATAKKPGSNINSTRLNDRNIVIDIEFLLTDNETIESIRNKTYKYFPTEKNLTLLFETDLKTCVCEGYVESNEPEIFSEHEGCQISIICGDPFFYASDSAGNKKTSTTVFYGVIPEFMFPFPDPSRPEPAILTGGLVKKRENSVFYTGEGEPGIHIVINATGEITNPKIYNTVTREHFYLDTDVLELMTGSPIIAGDEITIDTSIGKKSVTLLRNGVKTDILRCVVKGSDWFTLVKGDNLFAFTVDTGNAYISFRILNDIIYVGI